MTCLVAVEALSLIVALCFLGRFVLHVLGLVFALDVLAFASASAFALFALTFALRIRSELHWHWLTVDVLLCSRDLENLLSLLISACDPDAVPDEVSIPSIVTPILMSSSTVFVDWSRSRVRFSAASLVEMSRNLYPSTFIRSPTYLVRSLGSHSITNCLQASNPSFTLAL